MRDLGLLLRLPEISVDSVIEKGVCVCGGGGEGKGGIKSVDKKLRRFNGNNIVEKKQCNRLVKN